MSQPNPTDVKPAPRQAAPGQGVLLAISWLWVGIPLAWGVYTTLVKSLVLFQ